MRTIRRHGTLPGMNGAHTHSELTILGRRYRLIRPIGEGGMAVVWEARDEVLGRTVAVKVLAGRHLGDPQSRELIRHEARAAAALSHPNIAQVHDYGETTTPTGVFPWVVMELVRGDTLLSRASQATVTPRFAMRVCAEVAAALAAAHGEGIVHRDVKPANVMLAPTGAKVVDFGIAAAVAPGRTDEDFEVLGTPAYLAPERLISDVVEPASDVYALAILLYQLLAGCLPWTSETTTQMLTAHIYIDPVPLGPTPGVPDYVVDLCNRCLAKDPTMRPSAREVAAVLAHGARARVATGDPSHDEPAAAPPSPPVEEDLTAGDHDEDQDSAGPAPAVRPALPVRRWAVAAATTAFLLLAVWLFWTHGASRHRSVASTPSPQWQTSGAAPSASLVPVPSLPSALPSAKVVTVTATPPAQPSRAVAAGPGFPATSARPTTPTGTGPTGTGPTGTAPAVRSLTSPAGSVRATCPAATTAQILSAEAESPFKVQSTDTTPGPAPAAVFKHGNTVETMTVTCRAGEPATSNSVS
jgi:serine/threonine-protein kinase